MKITKLPAKVQNPLWPNANPKSRRQRIKAGEPRRVVRKDRPHYKKHMKVFTKINLSPNWGK